MKKLNLNNFENNMNVNAQSAVVQMDKPEEQIRKALCVWAECIIGTELKLS